MINLNYQPSTQYLSTGEYFERAAKRLGIEVNKEHDMILNIESGEPFGYFREGLVTGVYGIDVLHRTGLVSYKYDVYFATHTPKIEPHRLEQVRLEILPHGFDPELCDLDTEKEYDVVLSGRVDVGPYDRRNKIFQLLRKNFNCLTVPNLTPTKEYLKELSKAKFILNVSGWGEINRRVFDGMALGVSIFDHNDYVDMVGVPGEHFLTFKNEDDIIDIVKSYLDDEDKYNHVREAGRKHALENHTYDIRLKKAYDTLMEVYNERLHQSPQEGSTPH